MDIRIESLREDGRVLTADNYGKALRCLFRYCNNDNLQFSDLTEDFVTDFNAHLESKGVQKSTISFYNRTLRSIYNQAAKEGLIKNTHPFDNAYTKVITKLSPIPSIKTDTGESIEIDDLSKEELLRQYKTLRVKYNTLVNKLSAIVGA